MRLTRITLWLVLFASFAFVLPTFAQDATATPSTKSNTLTYTAENGAASVSFPADWIVKERSSSDSFISIKLGNSESALEKDLFDRDSVFESGEVHAEVDVIALEQLAKDLPGSTINTDSTPMDIIDAIAEQGMPDEFTFGKPGTTTIDGNPAVRMNLTADKRGEGQLVIAIINKKSVVAILLYAAAGEGDKWDLIARDIVSSVKFDVTAESTPEATPEVLTLTQTATSENGSASLSYPENWFTRQSSDNGIYVANSQSALEKSFGSSMGIGEVNIELNMTSTEAFLKQIDTPLKADASPYEILVAAMKGAGDSVKFGEPSETTVNDKRAASVDFKSQGFEGTAWLVEYKKGSLIAVQLLTAPGESLPWRQLALDIIQSVKFTG